MQTVPLWGGGEHIGHQYHSRPRQEYAADFRLLSRRVLNGTDYRLFHLHYLLEADWHRWGCLDLHMDRGTFFHRAYLIMERPGRVFAELRPYALYPVGPYF